MISSADLSKCRTYRYSLTRRWDISKPLMVVIGLNPSTADEKTDDPTIRRCMGYAKDWGHGGIAMINLYAFRATKPEDLWKAEDPVGPLNDRKIRSVINPWMTDQHGMVNGKVLCAWGGNAKPGRVLEFAKICDSFPSMNLMCLGTTKSGQPKHPLYLKKDEMPRTWRLYA